MENLTVDGRTYRAGKVDFPKSSLLFIGAAHGVLGCGYFNVDAAEKTGEALAVVTGVADFAGMLSAAVVRVSSAAAAKGVTLGMTGRRALENLEK